MRSAIKGNGFGYSLGMTATRLSKKKVLLPIDGNNKPNWDYMEKIGNTIYDNKNNNILEYLKEKHHKLSKEIENIEIKNLENKEWGTYSIKELFIPKRVVGKTFTSYNSGKFPFISTSSLKNGVQGFVEGNQGDFSPAKSLTINPIDGTVFYHSSIFIGRGGAGSSILSLVNKNINKYTGLFIKNTIESSSKVKASYGTQLNGQRLNSTKIMIPVTKDKEIDWEYMELYMKKIEYKKINKLINYLENK